MGSVGTVDVDVRANTVGMMSGMAKEIKGMQTQLGKLAGTASAAVDKGLTKPLKQSHIAASKTYGYMKDIGRIVQGIFISQVLYRGILQPKF